MTNSLLLQVIWAQHHQCGFKVGTVKRKAYNTLHYHSLVPFHKHNVTSTALSAKRGYCLKMWHKCKLHELLYKKTKIFLPGDQISHQNINWILPQHTKLESIFIMTGLFLIFSPLIKKAYSLSMSTFDSSFVWSS